MRVRAENISRTVEGGEFLLTLRGGAELAEVYAQYHEVDAEASFKPMKRKRSLDANAYCWALIDKLAEKTGLPKVDVYREAIRGIGGVSEIACVQDKAVEALRKGWAHNGIGWFADTMPSKIKGCTNVILYYGSSVYDTKQMHDLIDHIVQDCKALGIETMPPAEIAAIEAAWERRT